ncbi:calmodulin-A-like [Lineus longissimus]|uniref:calmodulin-A-like n=1 Tax=Lineus longissimus TaxID=88925 RepID=UPI00315D23FA
MDDATIARYKRAFDQFDVNGDGRVNKDEIRNSLKNMGFNPTDDMVEQIIKDGDKNNDGWLEWSEVLHSLKHKPQKEHEDAATRAALRARFRLLDTDDSGYITVDELRDAISKTGADIPAEKAEELIKAADRNFDGKVTYEEFLAVM